MQKLAREDKVQQHDEDEKWSKGHVLICSKSHLGWHFRKFKAQSSNVSFATFQSKETFKLWAFSFETVFENVTLSEISCTLAKHMSKCLHDLRPSMKIEEVPWWSTPDGTHGLISASRFELIRPHRSHWRFSNVRIYRIQFTRHFIEFVFAETNELSVVIQTWSWRYRPEGSAEGTKTPSAFVFLYE